MSGADGWEAAAFEPRALSLSLASVAVFRRVADGPVLAPLAAFLACEGAPLTRVRRYGAFLAALYEAGGDLGAYLIDAALTDDNACIRALAAGRTPPKAMADAAERELRLFSRLSALAPEALAAHAGAADLPLMQNTPADFVRAYRAQAETVRTRGYGVYARYGMFRLDGERIVPILHPDPIEIGSLVGYERERGLVVENTAALAAGLPAANVLLCGDAGTGKSSTVKAVANRFFPQGVRLLELRKEQLRLLPGVMDELSGNPLKFILFLDDLSFQRNDDSFGELKAILEGTAAAKAPNVAIYATSNRRHLVRETFSERDGDDVHRQDTLQEIASLSERFGLSVLFGRPDKALYLTIVQSLALRAGIPAPPDGFAAEAEAFALRKGGRSARAAEQFVQSLAARRG